MSSVAHGIYYGDLHKTICGLNTAAKYCHTGLSSHTPLCINCRKVLRNIKPYDKYWYQLDYRSQHPLSNMEHNIVILDNSVLQVVPYDLLFSYRITIQNYSTEQDRPMVDMPILDVIDTTMLWLSGRHFGIPLSTFIEGIAGSEHETAPKAQ